MYKDYNDSNDGDLDSLKIYLREINKISLLTFDEEQELGKRIIGGDNLAKQKMINSNLRLVVHIAKKFQHRGLPLMYLIEAGNDGLIRAVEKFDYKKNCKFSSYAAYWIKTKIQKGIRENPMMPISQRKKHFLGWVLRLQDEGKSVKEISKILNLSLEKVKDLLAIPNSVVSFDSLSSSEGNMNYHDFITDERYSPEFKVKIAREKIFSVLQYLPKREAEILKFRFGFVDGCEYTLRELALKYDITPEGVRQIEQRAIRKLRNPLYKSKLEACLEK